MLRVEKIKIADLPQLAGLYDQLVEEKTDQEINERNLHQHGSV